MFTTEKPASFACYIPPAWTNVTYNTDANAACIAMGRDAAGREQRVYSPAHHQLAKSLKFQRIRQLLAEASDIRTRIESDVNAGQWGDAALLAYLVFETGIRPGSNKDTRAQKKAYGGTTLQARHVKPCTKGARLVFVGKKGVAQNIMVTNPHLVAELLSRKKRGGRLFGCSAAGLNDYIAELGEYTAKDFRTMRGTAIAVALLGKRKRLPKAKAARKRLMNAALDKVAKELGNTRNVCRSSYVDPEVLARYVA